MDIKSIGSNNQKVQFKARLVTLAEREKIFNYCDSVFKTTADYPQSLLSSIENAAMISTKQFLTSEQSVKLSKMIDKGFDILLGKKDRDQLSQVQISIVDSYNKLYKGKLVHSLLDERKIMEESGLVELYQKFIKQGKKKSITVDEFQKAANKIAKIEAKTQAKIKDIRDNIV